MFFNVRGIRWTLLAILVVIVLSILDLRCSFSRDRAAREEAATGSLGGIISHVREEVAAGHKEIKIQQIDQINEQLRDLRVIARRMVKAGKTKGRPDIIDYRKAIGDRNRKLLDVVNGAYDTMHLYMGYDGTLSKKVCDGAFEYAALVIGICAKMI